MTTSSKGEKRLLRVNKGTWMAVRQAWTYFVDLRFWVQLITVDINNDWHSTSSPRDFSILKYPSLFWSRSKQYEYVAPLNLSDAFVAVREGSTTPLELLILDFASSICNHHSNTFAQQLTMASLSLHSLLLTSAYLLSPVFAIDAQLAGTWSTKSAKVLTGPVCARFSSWRQSSNLSIMEACSDLSTNFWW